jgi:hypothetical protein
VHISPYYIRLFHPEKQRHERLVNLIANGPAGRLGLDGRAYAVLQSIYGYMIVLKVRELERAP